MSKQTFNLDSLNLDDVLSTDEMASIDAGAISVATTSFSSAFPIDTASPGWNMNGEAIWSMIP